MDGPDLGRWHRHLGLLSLREESWQRAGPLVKRVALGKMEQLQKGRLIQSTMQHICINLQTGLANCGIGKWGQHPLLLAI